MEILSFFFFYFRFIGEDLMGVQRRRAQQEQQRAWLLQQVY